MSQTQSFPGSFYQAHHFDIHNSTFVDNSGNVRKLEELKVDLKNTVIERATYDELPRIYRDQFGGHVPRDIEEWVGDPSSFQHRFLNTANKDILSFAGIPIVRFFRDNKTPGIKLVAHILFYDIPITDEAHIISSRPHIAHRWVTTLAYQLMLNVPEIMIPMLEALHLDPRIPRYNSEDQLRKLIINPFKSVVERGLLNCDETLVVLLHCVDCSMDATAMASDIAYLIDELESINDLRLKLVITGLPDKRVLSLFWNVPIQVSELHWPKRVPNYTPRKPPPPTSLSLIDKWRTLSVLQKKYCTELLLSGGCLACGGILSLGIGSIAGLYIAAGLVGVGTFVEGCISLNFYLTYWSLKFQRPWDVHGREEAVKKSILERMDEIALARWQ